MAKLILELANFFRCAYKMSESLISSLIVNAQRNLYLDIVPLPGPGAKLDEFTVISNINQFYGLYGYSTALAAISAQGHLLIVFRGTDDLSDVMTDVESIALKTWPEVDPTGTAQFGDGFLDVFKSIFVPWLAAIPMQNVKSVTVTGHSLGGAFAFFASMWLTPRLSVKPVIYTYAAPFFGNLAAKQRMERLGLQIFDVAAENDPVPAIKFLWAWRIGNGGTAPQRNYILSGSVEAPTLITPPNSSISWFPNPAYADKHSLITTYIPMLQNILAGINGGVKCTYNASAVRNDSTRACAAGNTLCVKNGKLTKCGNEGWCGSNGLCVSKYQPYNCVAAADCNVGGMCHTPGYNWPTSSWDSLTEPCKLGATCSWNPWDFSKYCWNK